MPSTSLRAGSSLRLKNGSAQDDSRRVILKLHRYPFNGLLCSFLYVEYTVEQVPHMEIVQIVLDKKLLHAADQAAKRTKRNRSALVRDALREHLRRLELRAVRSATARATCGCRKPTPKRGDGNRRPRGRKRSPG